MKPSFKYLLVICFMHVVSGLYSQVDWSDFPAEYQALFQNTENKSVLEWDYSNAISIIEPSCNGNEDGMICIDLNAIIGGEAPYTVNFWDGPCITGLPNDTCKSNICAGTYTIVVQAANGDLDFTEVEVGEPSAIVVVEWNFNPPSCFGILDGGANPFVVGSAGDFTFSYNNGPFVNEPLNNNLGNPFNLTIMDGDGCITDTTFFDPTAAIEIVVDSTIQNTCFNETTGFIDIDVSGGNPIPGIGYTYSWSLNGGGQFSTSQNISNLGAGTYTVVVTDASPCTTTKDYVIEESPEILSSSSIAGITCFGDNNGGISPNISGGISPYSYNWSGPNTITNSETQINLPAGDFNLIVTDSLGCTLDADYIIEEPDSILITAVITSINCNGDNDGSIVTDITSGNPPYNTISWESPSCYNGPLDIQNLTNLCGGVYEITVFDINNCSNSATFVVDEPDAIMLDLTKTDISCFGANDGSIDLVISGGAQPPTTPVWSPMPFDVIGNGIGNLTPNTYTVVYTDDNNCVASESMEILENGEIVVTENVIDASCMQGDGSIIVDITGGVAEYELTWTNEDGDIIGNSTSIINLDAGDYTLSVLDNQDCIFEQTYTINAPEEIIIISNTFVPALCFGASNGVIDIDVVGGDGTFSYTWIGTPEAPSPNNTQDVSGLSAGVYTVVVTSGDCVSTKTFIINEDPEIVLDFDVNQISCSGYEDGAIDLSVTGSGSTFGYIWTGPACFDGATSEDIANLCEGTYIVEVTNQSGCTNSGTVVLNEPEVLDIVGDVTDITCYNTNTGEIDITVNGAITTPIYSWTGSNFNANTEDVSNLFAGDYDVTVDLNGCIATQSFTVLENDSLYLEVVLTPYPCNGSVLGSIDITPHGGTAPYTYLWTGDGITAPDNENQDQTDLSGGIYSVVVTDFLGCTYQEDFVMTPSAMIDINSIFNDINCFGEENGTIITNPTGGEEPYTFSWTGPDLFFSEQQNISNLAQGDYNLTIQDINGCISSDLFTINEPNPIELTINIIQPICGSDNGSLTINTIGGVGITTVVVMKAGVIVNDISNLGTGVYVITAEDSNNCTTTETVTLSNSDITISGNVMDVACFGGNTGSITITIDGATGTPNISWIGDGVINNPNSTVVSELIAGDYIVTVNDDNNCEAVMSFEVLENDEIIVAADVNSVFCASDTNGSIELTETIGGTGGYTYIWNSDIHDDFEASSIFDLPPGTYQLTVSDVASCTITNDYVIESVVELTITADVIDVACFGDDSGEIDIDVSGGTPSYSYLWTGGSDQQDIQNIVAGSYTVMISDENNCQADSTFVIGSNTPLFGDAIITNIDCNNEETGSIELINLGGSGNYSFNWSSVGYNSNDQDIFNLGVGEYILNIEDDLNCSFDTLLSVTENLLIEAEVAVNNVACYGDATGSLVIESLSGGQGTITPTWSPIPNGATVENGNLMNIPAGDYTLTLEDESGCIISKEYSIDNENTEISVFALIDGVDCAGDSSGSIDIDISGGVQPFNISWSGESITDPTIEDPTDLSANTYTLSITDELGCSKDTSFVVTESNLLTLDVISISHNQCYQDGTGSIDIQIEGGTPLYEYTWTDGNGVFETTQDVNGLNGGDYTVHIEDVNSCSIEQTFTINEPAELTFNLDANNSTCGLENGHAEVNEILGGIPEYSINWFNTNTAIGTGSSIDGLSPGLYMVEITDENNCSANQQFTLSDDVGNLTAMVQSLLCFGDMNGAIVVTANGMTNPISYQWTSDNNFTSSDSSITGLDGGTYTILVTDNNGCELIESYDLSDPDELELSATIFNETCPSAEDGMINLSVLGGTGIYQYNWSGMNIINPQNQDQDNLAPNVYTVSVTDDNNCEIIENYIVAPAVDFEIVESISNVTCFGSNDGSIILDLDFGSNTPIENMSFNWLGNNVDQNAQNQFNLIAGEYSVVVTTPNGCIHEETFIVSESPIIEIDVITTSSTCLLSNGSASASISGGMVAGDYTYTWLHGSGEAINDNDNIIDNISAGVYQLIATDDLNCSVSQDFVLSDVGGVLDYEVTNVSCPGLNDGAIDITYGGMTEPVGIIWSGPEGNYNPTDEDISNLILGDYTVLITAMDGCILGDIITVEEKEFITSFANITNVSCNGLSDGAIDITITGGEPEYNISWTGPNGDVTPDVNGDLSSLEVGIYTVIISDQALCWGTNSFEVIEPDPLSLVEQIIDVSCFGLNDGEVNLVNVDGGTTPYSFSWTQDENPDYNSSFQSIDNIQAGTYNVLITDDNDCTLSDSFMVNENGEIFIDITTTTSSCELPTGTATVTATGGEGGYSYEWYTSDNFLLTETGNEIGFLVQGSYYVVVSDGSDCTSTLDFLIQNEDYTVTSTITDILCYGNATGEISIELSDDFTMPIMNLSWTSSQMDNIPSNTTISNLVAGEYTLFLSDATGCPYEQTYEITQPDSLIINVVEINLNCNNDGSGSIVLSPTGGTPLTEGQNYNYNWNVPVGEIDPGNIHFSENIGAGNYSIQVVDANTCTTNVDIDITEPEPLVLVASIQDIVCESDTDGSIEVFVSGGTTEYNYDWSTGGETSSIENLTVGSYTLNFTDAKSCAIDTTFSITASVIIELQYTVDSISCYNVGDGAIDLTATGGSEQFDFIWNAQSDGNVNNIVTEDISNLLGGDYYLLLTDQISGCIKRDTLSILNPDSLYASSIVTDLMCFGNNSGMIDQETMGGTSPYEYNWTSNVPGFFEDQEDADELEAGFYSVEITDSHNCVNIYDFEITEPSAIIVVVDSTVNAFCYTSEDGSLYTTITGGSPGYILTWTNDQNDEFSGDDLTGIVSGTYSLTVTDANQCNYLETVEVGYDQEVIAIIDNQEPACDQLPVTLSGGQSIGADSYSWEDNQSQQIGTGPTVDITLGFTYNEFILTVSNNVCSHSDTLTLLVNPLPLVDAGVDQDVFPEDIVELGGDPTGPTAVAYHWEPGLLLNDSSIANPEYFNVGTQEFIVTVTDGNGCMMRDSILITLVNQVVIPDGFSPNDDGVNDVWNIANSDKFPEMEANIYNRWGDKLYESKGTYIPWDGKYEGKHVPVGTYYYVIRLHDPLFPKPFTGPLTIFR